MAKLVKRELDKALAQFIGYRAAKDGETIVQLAVSMGLRLEEYKAIRDEIPSSKFTHDMAELDEFFGLETSEDR